MKIRIATRKSPLALAQTRWVGAQLRAHNQDLEIEEVQIVTRGDQILDKPLAKIGGKGLFINEVEAALVDGRADIAVHSMKDVPDGLAEGLGLICVPKREDPTDILVSAQGLGLLELPSSALVGTSSLRRACQLFDARPDLRFEVIRGNVGTRLRKLDEGLFDAIVLARAGLNRLELDQERPLSVLSIDLCLPAVGQGALGIEGRLDAGPLLKALAPLECQGTRLAVEAERAYLSRLQGSCTTPIAAYARFDENGPTRMCMDGMVGAVDGSSLLKATVDAYVDAPDHAARLQQAIRMGVELAEMQLDRGAAALIRDAVQSPDAYRVGPYANARGGPLLH